MSAAQLPIPAEDLRRILVIRRNRMGDMICTLPLLRALRKNFPEATIKVACDELGAPIARACEAVNEVIVLKKGFNRLHTLLRNLRELRSCDAAIGVKVGFDRLLAGMVRCSGARHRIGFTRDARSPYYNHPVALPPSKEHQIESCLRLLEPLGIRNPSVDLHLKPHAEAVEFADRLAAQHALERRFFAVFNLSSNRAGWPLANFARLGSLLLRELDCSIGICCLPTARPAAQELEQNLRSDDVFVFFASTPMELAAVFQRAQLLLTVEGGAAHLAETVEAPAIVLWPRKGPFEKWRSRTPAHHHIRSDGSLDEISVDVVWAVVQRHFPVITKP